MYDVLHSKGLIQAISSLRCSFAAALIENKLDCWVLSVVPISGPNTLPVIYDRGLLGVMHDWYAISTNMMNEVLCFACQNMHTLLILLLMGKLIVH